MEQEVNFIDELLKEAELKEEQQSQAYFDLIVLEISKLEEIIAQNFIERDKEIDIIKDWTLRKNAKYQDRIDFYHKKLEAYIREMDKKTISLPHGTLKIRKSPDRVEISDLDQFLSNANGELVSVVPETFKPNLNLIKTYIKNTGHIPDGVNVIEGSERFKLSLNKSNGGTK